MEISTVNFYAFISTYPVAENTTIDPLAGIEPAALWL